MHLRGLRHLLQFFFFTLEFLLLLNSLNLFIVLHFKIDSCMLCAAPFTMTLRRHHCRYCAKLVCGTCSTKTFPLKSSINDPIYEPSRVCDGCFNCLYYMVREKEGEIILKLNMELFNTNGMQYQTIR